jgi:hypothetical protein
LCGLNKPTTRQGSTWYQQLIVYQDTFGSYEEKWSPEGSEQLWKRVSWI